MINWIAGNWPIASRALVATTATSTSAWPTTTPRSCGSRSGSTAACRGRSPEGYAKHNPIDFVKNWKTPTLVVHGGLDYRVVDTQGMATFTALQRKGIPSRFLYFPDENHWVLKPQNSMLWHETVLGVAGSVDEEVASQQ